MKIQFEEVSWRAAVGEYEAVVTDISSLGEDDKPFRLYLTEPDPNRQFGKRSVSYHKSRQAAYSAAARWLGKHAGEPGGDKA